MKYIFTLAALNFILPLFSQSEDGKTTIINFEYTKSEDPNAEYPRIEIDEGDWVTPIVEMQGIKVGYAKQQDYEAFFDGQVLNSWDVWVYVENNTGKDIVYANANDWVASIKFPGQETYYLAADESTNLSRTGGRCPFLAYMLEKENGKYVMKAGKSYNWAFTIYRDVDNIALQAVQKFFRPIYVETLVPSSYSINKAPDLIAYRETTNPNKIQKDLEGGSNRHRLDLPKEYVFLSPYYTSYKPKTPFKKDGAFDIIFNNGSLQIGLRQINNSGEFEYQTKNIGMQKLSTVHMDPFATLYLNEGAKVDLRLSKNKMNARYLQPGEVFTKTIKLELPHPSGEVYVKNDNFSPRKSLISSSTPTKLIIREVAGFMKEGAAFTAGKSAINIFIGLPSYGKNKPCAIILEEDFKEREIVRVQPYQIQLSKAGKIRWFNSTLYDSRYPTPEKRKNKAFSEKPGLWKSYVTTLDVQLGEQYYFVCYSDEVESTGACTSVSQEKWNQIVTDAGADPKNPKIIIPGK